MLSIEEGIRQSLDLNLGDGEIKGDVLEKFWIWRLKDLCNVFVL